MDQFVEGLKHAICIEVLKGQVETFDECARIAFSVESAIWRPRKESSSGKHNGNIGPILMEIGNTERQPGTKAQRGQQRKNF